MSGCQTSKEQSNTGSCPQPLGAADEIASTPRDDKNLEQLALELDSERVVASQETYDRVVADVQAIRQLDKQLADVPYFAPDDAQTLMLSMSDLAFQGVEAGTYSAWDCLTAFYGLLRKDTMTVFGKHYVELTLEGNYNLPVLSKVFAKLPGVTNVEAAIGGGDGPTICARRVGEALDYVVDRRGGDCLAGCNSHQAQHFVSTAKGAVQAGETWNGETQTLIPAWYAETCTRR